MDAKCEDCGRVLRPREFDLCDLCWDEAVSLAAHDQFGDVEDAVTEREFD